ncbi:hypothetical protein [Actinomadura rupiterrae]|uniref:hypothetical protein n=1 Tax=Actinomadura rupiterrae TaxID=559627 RepID=UPI0020A2379A|nr:hypothetical protein [Actinomadura rupiterrae]MCP2335889.1 hypothetical protein [Actinomadura rupiterrae]
MLVLAIAAGAGVLGALALVLAVEAVRLARDVRAGQRRIAHQVELQTRVMAAAARLAAAATAAAAADSRPPEVDGRPDGSSSR